MKRNVRLTSAANLDLARVADFLADRNPAAALRAYDTLDAAIQSLDELIVPLGSGAYVVQYRVAATSVVVARIFHGREDR